MEKRGVVDPGITRPSEPAQEKAAEACKTGHCGCRNKNAQVQQLDNDPTRRLADKAEEGLAQK